MVLFLVGFFLFLLVANSKRFSSIELFQVWMFLSSRCSITAFFFFFFLFYRRSVFFLFICLVSFYQPDGWDWDWTKNEYHINVYAYACVIKRTDSNWKSKPAHTNWQWTTFDMLYHFGKQTSDLKWSALGLYTYESVAYNTDNSTLTHTRAHDMTMPNII